MKDKFISIIKKYFSLIIIIIVVFVSIYLAANTKILPKSSENSIFQNKDAWVCLESDGKRKVDTFFVIPTVYSDNQGTPNLQYEDNWHNSFNNSFNKYKGIFSLCTNVYSPFYEQVNGDYANNIDSEKYYEIAYQSVKEAFLYYIDNYNNGKPFILAGHSQGSNMIIRLLKEFGDYDVIKEQLVAAYCIGWRIEESEVEEFDLRMAQNENDTGVIISFNTEAKGIKNSFVINDGMKTISINPLNWKTDGTKANKELNLVACFVDKKGNIFDEKKNLTGAYINEERGSIIVTDIDPNEYYEEEIGLGIYHAYDYFFFYRNIQKNVRNRIIAYFDN